MSDFQDTVDHQYAARKQDESDLSAVDAYLAQHPEYAKTVEAPGAGMQPPKSPEEAAQQQQQIEGYSGSEAAKTTGDKVVDYAAGLPGTLVTSSLKIAGATPEHADLAGNLTNAAMMGYGLAKGGVAAYKGIKGMVSGAEKAAPAILDEFGNVASAAGEGTDGASAVTSGAGASPSPAAEVSHETPTPVTPDAAAQTLAQKQIDALKEARVGKDVAAEFGRPDIAQSVSNEQTMKEAAALRAKVEPFYGDRRPPMAAHTAAYAEVFQTESNDLHTMALDIVNRAHGGEDVTADMGNLTNRFSAFATNYANFAGTRSEIGRAMQILNPLKPENLRVTETAKIAQQLGDNPADLAEMLSRLTPDQLPRFARQAAESVQSGGSLYGGLMEYYKANLLSNPRTYARVPVSNAVTTLMEIPIRAVASVMPGGGADAVNPQEPLAMIRGIKDGFREAVDYAQKSFRSGRPEFWIDTGTPYQGKPPQITAKNFGLDETPLGTAIDYLGEAIRVPYRALTAAHQFGYVMATSAQEHALAWRSAAKQAATEGLEGSAGSTRASELYQQSINDRTFLEGGKQFADLTTFASDLGPTGKKFQAVANVPGVNVVVPFFKVWANMTKYGSQYVGSKVMNPWSEFYQPGAAGQIARARVATGSLLAGLVAYETARGNITGEGLHMDPAAKALARQNGWQPYSVRVGGKYVEIPEPLRLPMGIVANATESMNHLDEPTAGQYAMSAVLGTTHALTNSSVILGVKHIMDAIENPEGLTAGQTGDRLLGQEIEGFVPGSSLLRGIKSSIDPTQRNTSRDPTSEGWASHLEGVQNYLKAQFPIASEKLPPQVDMFGRPVVRAPGVLQNMVFPVNLTDEKHDPVEDEIIRIQPTVPEVPTSISGRAEKVMDNPNDPDIGVPLTPEQQRQWAEFRGEGLKERLAHVMGLPLYAHASMGLKKDMLEYVVSANSEKATYALLKSDPTLMARYRDRQIAKGVALRTPEDVAAAAPEVR